MTVEPLEVYEGAEVVNEPVVVRPPRDHWVSASSVSSSSLSRSFKAASTSADSVASSSLYECRGVEGEGETFIRRI